MRWSESFWILSLQEKSLIRHVVGHLSGAPSLFTDSREVGGISDWRKLQAICETTNAVPINFELHTPLGRLPVEDISNKAGYGFTEIYSKELNIGPIPPMSGKAQKMDLDGFSVYWWEGDHVECRKIFVAGLIQRVKYRNWLPCMLGQQEAISAPKERGIIVR